MQSVTQHSTHRGDYLPIHGTCLGFELLCMLANEGDISVLSRVDAENISLPLRFTAPPRDSSLFSLLSHEQVRCDTSNHVPSSPLKAAYTQVFLPPNSTTQLALLSERRMTENWHHWGVELDTWTANKRLTDFFRLISISDDR
jgi:gamma-glutamyl hydrolase